MGPKGKKETYSTPCKKRMTCGECGKEGPAYQCGFCELYMTCGECGMCNEAVCGCTTKVIKVVEKTKITASGGSPPKATTVKSEGKTQIQEATTTKAQTEVMDRDAYVEQLVEKAQQKREKKAERREKEKQKQDAETAVPVPKSGGKKRSSVARETMPAGQAQNVGAVRAATVAGALESLDVSAIAKTAGNLQALKALLEEHFTSYAIPPAKIGTVPTAKTLGEPYDTASSAVKTALEDAVRACQDPKATTHTYCQVMDDIVRDQRRPDASKGQGHALMLLAQAMAAVWPAEVCAAADYALKAHKEYRSQQVSIPLMWAMAQPWQVDTARTLEAWWHQAAPALVASQPDRLVQQYVAKYTELLATHKVVGEEGGGINLDILAVCLKAYSKAAEATAQGEVLQSKLDWFVRAWLHLATPAQLENTFHKAVTMFEKPPANTKYQEALVDLVYLLLARHPPLFEKWGAIANDRTGRGHGGHGAYLVASQRVLEALQSSGKLHTLPSASVKGVLGQLVAAGETPGGKQGKAGDKRGTPAKVQSAVGYFKTLDVGTRSPRGRSTFCPLLLVIMVLLAVTLKINAHCLEYPCGNARPCDADLHPCKLVRSEEVAPLMDSMTVKLQQAKDFVMDYAEPYVPQINAATEALRTSVYEPGMAYATVAQQKAQRQWIVHGAPLIKRAHIYTAPVEDAVWRGVDWLEVNVKPTVDRSVAAALPHCRTAIAWTEANVLAPGRVYGNKAWQWTDENVVPKALQWWAIGRAAAGEYVAHVTTHTLPWAMAKTEKSWQATQVYASQAAKDFSHWCQTTALPKAKWLQAEGMKRLDVARHHTRRALSDVMPWVEENVKPQLVKAWEAVKDAQEDVLNWSEERFNDIKGWFGSESAEATNTTAE